jgi:hypothetical protein
MRNVGYRGNGAGRGEQSWIAIRGGLRPGARSASLQLAAITENAVRGDHAYAHGRGKRTRQGPEGKGSRSSAPDLVRLGSLKSNLTAWIELRNGTAGSKDVSLSVEILAVLETYAHAAADRRTPHDGRLQSPAGGAPTGDGKALNDPSAKCQMNQAILVCRNESQTAVSANGGKLPLELADSFERT